MSPWNPCNMHVFGKPVEPVEPVKYRIALSLSHCCMRLNCKPIASPWVQSLGNKLYICLASPLVNSVELHDHDEPVEPVQHKCFW